MVYWPETSKDIENIASTCETCLKFSASNRQPKPDNQLGHEVPVVPWKTFVTDIFTFDNCNCMLVVDYSSKFPILKKLPSLTTKIVTEIIKSIFAKYDRPTNIVRDNGPCYPSKYLTRQMANWGIHHITTSPHHYLSNGLAEVYVKISKTILQKAKVVNEDPHFAMMAYRTTPIGPNTPILMELMHGCRSTNS